MHVLVKGVHDRSKLNLAEPNKLKIHEHNLNAIHCHFGVNKLVLQVNFICSYISPL